MGEYDPKRRAAFIHEAVFNVEPPTAWYCMLYDGPRVRDDVRRDNAVAVPPIRLDQWLKKPASMRVLTARSADEALDWLAGQVTAYAPRLTPADPNRLPRLLGYVEAYRSGEDSHLVVGAKMVHWQENMAGGKVVAWAIVPDTSPDLVIHDLDHLDLKR